MPSGFPGNVMIVDELYDELIHGDINSLSAKNKIQYDTFDMVRQFSKRNGLPLVSITNTALLIDVQEEIRLYNNVRLLILDLDLDNDGDVNESDKETVRGIIRTSVNQFGYFFLAIASSNMEHWDEIKEPLLKDTEIKPLLEQMTFTVDKKTQSFEDEILHLMQAQNKSVEFIFDFESNMNDARDKSLGQFIDYEKGSKSWTELDEYKKEENTNLNTFFMSILQHWLDQNVGSTDLAQVDEAHENIDEIESTYNVKSDPGKWQKVSGKNSRGILAVGILIVIVGVLNLLF